MAVIFALALWCLIRVVVFFASVPAGPVDSALGADNQTFITESEREKLPV